MPFGRRCRLTIVLFIWFAADSPAQVKRPAPPAHYDVTLRFLLRLQLPAWYDRFDEMLADLQKLGFERTNPPSEGIEDPNNDRLDGRIASGQARRLLSYQSVQTILLKPQGFRAEAGQPVKIRIELAAGLPGEQQQLLHRQVAERLRLLGFREAPGYFHESFTMLLGVIDGSKLGDLLDDLRRVPAGWLVPNDPVSTLPLPLRERVPIRVIEVLTEPADLPALTEPPTPMTFPAEQAHWAKIEPSLLALVGPQADDTRTLRVEVVFAQEPAPGDSNWERLLRGTASSVRVEGLVGNVATVTAHAHQVTELARPTSVIWVRQPRTGQGITPPLRPTTSDPWEASRLKLFHQLGHQGQGIKVAIVAGDFRGFDQFVGKRLPAGTRLLDLTAARNPDMRPDPMPEGEGVGQGTLMALTVAAAAPQADLVLVRVDPSSPYQLLTIARLINESNVLPLVLEDRFNELEKDRTGIDLSRTKALEDRRRALANLEFDFGDARVPEIKKRVEESKARLEQAETALDEIAKRETELQERTARYLKFRESLNALRGTRIVLNALTWESGWPVDGASALSRYLDEQFDGDPGEQTVSRIRSMRRGAGTIWVQATSDCRGQFWTGLFRDEDRNGVMEFVPMGASLPPGRWTSELNFLGWRPFDGQATTALPARSKARVSLQWREPHDAGVGDLADDPYREPICNFRIVILRQRDPTGTKVGNDEMEVVARSQANPVRLHLGKNSGTYELVADFEVPTEGNYAVRIEGTTARSPRPSGDLGKENGLGIEIRPRLFVEILDPQWQNRGRVVFADFSDLHPIRTDRTAVGPSGGGVGMPADACQVLTVAADDPLSSWGAGPNRLLATKPDILGPSYIPLGDGLEAKGSWGASAFNAGVVACTLSSQAVPKPSVLLQRLGARPNTRLSIPESWLRQP